MTSKLGVHYQRVHSSPQLRAWLNAWRPSVVKLIVSADNDAPGLDEALACLAPGGRVIIRHHPVSENWEHRGMADRKSAIEMGHAHSGYLLRLWNVIRKMYKVAPEQLLWEGLNEPNVWASEPPLLTAAYYATFAADMHKGGHKVVMFSAGVGWPGNGGVPDAPVDWRGYEEMRDAMKPGDVLGLHEYWPMAGPGYAWGWLAGRYTQCPWQVPIIIGESGLDNAVAPGVRAAGAEITQAAATDPFDWNEVNDYIMAMATRHKPIVSDGIAAASLEHYGFHGLSPNMDEAARLYMGQMQWYDSKLAMDKRVIAHTPFTFDFAQPWPTFDIAVDPMMNALLAYLIAVGGCAPWAAVPVVIPPPVVTPVVWGDKRLSPYRDLIDKYSTMRALDPMVVATVIMLESAGNPDAVSVAAAVGLMQVMPSPIIAGRPTKEDLLDPTTNIEWGTQIFKDELAHFGQLDKALVAYYRGRSHGEELTDPKSVQYLTAFIDWWKLLWKTTPPVVITTDPVVPPVTPTPDFGLDAVRWNAEEAVRELEGLQQAASGMRKRLLENVITPLYKLEAGK